MVFIRNQILGVIGTAHKSSPAIFIEYTCKGANCSSCLLCVLNIGISQNKLRIILALLNHLHFEAVVLSKASHCLTLLHLDYVTICINVSIGQRQIIHTT